MIDKKLTPTINRLNSRVFNFNSSTSISNQLVKIVSLHIEFSLARVIHYLEAAKVDGRSDDEAKDVGRRIVEPQQGCQDEVATVGSKNHVPVEVDGLCILFGDLLRASRQLFALLLGKFFHRGDWKNEEAASGCCQKSI